LHICKQGRTRSQNWPGIRKNFRWPFFNSDHSEQFGRRLLDIFTDAKSVFWSLAVGSTFAKYMYM